MIELSHSEQTLGRGIFAQLRDTKPLLSPNKLAYFINEYKKFSPLVDKYGLWVQNNTKDTLNLHKGRYKKVVTMVSGIAASGKDASYIEMKKLAGHIMHRAVTATSRPRRTGEEEGVHYYFYESKETFKKAFDEGDFVESTEQGNRYYGLPKKSIRASLEQPLPIIFTHVEMKGWKAVEEYVRQVGGEDTFVLKYFMLPHMDFARYTTWSSQERDDLEYRNIRTGWEIAEAPHRSDFLVSNRIKEGSLSLTYTAQAMLDTALELLDEPRSYTRITEPFANPPSMDDIEEILSFHDSFV